MKIGTYKISSKWSVVIPPAIRQGLGLSKGECVEWHIENGQVVLKKKEATKSA